jgi:acetyl esterase/lipase
LNRITPLNMQRSIAAILFLVGFAGFSLAQERPRQERPMPPLPAGFKKISDVEYVPGGGASRSLDLYVPEAKPAKALPLIVWIHGGAWLAGNKDRPNGTALLKEGFALASINYRLSKEAIFPAQIEDCKAAIRFLRAKAGEYGVDPARIGVFGSSAGGHLVALLGVAADKKDWEVGEHLNQSSQVQAVCDWFGPTNISTMGAQSRSDSRLDHDAPDSPESKLIGATVPDAPEKAKAASPLTYVTADDTQMLIIHGDVDPVVPVQQSETFHAALEKAGVKSKLHIVKGGGHGQGFQVPEVQQAVREFFVGALKPSSPSD